MPLIFRAMRADGGKPLVGTGSKCLGVRPGEIPVDEGGLVHPGTGGMSVAPSWPELPHHLIPKRLRQLVPKASGTGNFTVWKMGDGPFVASPVSPDLVLRPDPKDPDRHGFVEPARSMTLDEYLAALAATRDSWSRIAEDQP
jgi:hypothetical protein